MKKKYLVVIITIILILATLTGLSLLGIMSNLETVEFLDNESKDYLYSLDERNIKIDKASGIEFVNNIVIVTFEPEVSEEKQQEIVNSIGDVRGSIEEIDQYQIEIPECSLEELKARCDEIETIDGVFCAFYDSVSTFSADAYYPDDPWENASWDEEKQWWKEANWWAEAVDLPGAWEYKDKMQPITLGIVDSGYDYNHEELKGKLKCVEKSNLKKNIDWNHGTEVAGIICAKHNNNVGFSGVVDKCTLLAYSWKYGKNITSMKNNKQAESQILYGLVKEVTKGAKVINLSVGCSSSLYSEDDSFSEEWINEESYRAASTMAMLLDRGYDFIVVQSAGNGCTKIIRDNKGNLKDVKYIGIDAINNGMFASVTESNCISGKICTARDILDRIIIVGAAKYAKDEDKMVYRQCDFSNAGEQVDICAPGENIYTCSNLYQDTILKRKYKNQHNLYTNPDYNKSPDMLTSGTSLAAPIVTGIAGLVWSCNESLTGANVKHILCDENNIKYRCVDNEVSKISGIYPLVNAKLAVEAALRYSNGVQNYSEYIGEYFLPMETNRYHFGEKLVISDITDEYIDFDYQISNPGHAIVYTAERAHFLDAYTAKAKGTMAYGDMPNDKTPFEYTIKLSSDHITVTKTFSDSSSETDFYLTNPGDMCNSHFDISHNYYYLMIGNYYIANQNGTLTVSVIGDYYNTTKIANDVNTCFISDGSVLYYTQNGIIHRINLSTYEDEIVISAKNAVLVDCRDNKYISYTYTDDNGIDKLAEFNVWGEESLNNNS